MRGKSDSCDTVRLTVEIQKNGLIRDEHGWVIASANDDWMRYQWKMLASGSCPCCGREVDG